MLLVPTIAVADSLARAGAARSRIHVVPERLATSVVRGPLDGVRQRASRLIAILDDRGGRMFVCSDTDHCEGRRAAGHAGPGGSSGRERE